MIGFLEGKVKVASRGKVILLCNGIGFTVSVPNNLTTRIDEQLALFVHTHVREDNLSLFGFQRNDDLDLFEKLISVSGIGPKTALALFSSTSGDNIVQAISQSNLAFFTSIPGIGKKSAQKIILDLKSKIGSGSADISQLEENSELADSLASLGFQKSEIVRIMPQIDQSLDLSGQVKSALKLLNTK